MRVVEVFADVWCPFTHVGLRRILARRRALGRDDIAFRIRAWPLELQNGEPLDADFVGEEIEALRAQVAGDLFAGFDRDAFPGSTLPALELAAAAYEHSVQQGEAVSLALRDALFEEGRNIASDDVLTRIAGAAHVTRGDDEHRRTAVLDDWAEGKRQGVIGSPHFFVGDDSFFCPSLAITRDDNGHLRVAFDAESFEAFLGRVFGD
jgi:predicted DsbA family dithiol-disulfide isomerase